MWDLPSGPVWPWGLSVPIAWVGSQGDGGIKSAAPRGGRGLGDAFSVPSPLRHGLVRD